MESYSNSNATMDNMSNNLNSTIDKTKDNLEAVKNTVNEKKERISRDVAQKLNQTKDQAQVALEKTSEKIKDASMFLQSHEVQDLSRMVMDLVKRHPGKSIAAAAFIGMLFGSRCSRSHRD